MGKLRIKNLSNKILVNLLLMFLVIPHAIVSVLLGYYFSFVPIEVQILRDLNNVPTAIIEQQNIFLWTFITTTFFIWGLIILLLMCECIKRIINKKS